MAKRPLGPSKSFFWSVTFQSDGADPESFQVDAPTEQGAKSRACRVSGNKATDIVAVNKASHGALPLHSRKTPEN